MPAKKSSKSAKSGSARFADMEANVQSKASRREFLPGVLVVRCKDDVVQNVPDVARARVASVASFRLPEAVESPFDFLRQNDLLREVVPVFSRMMGGRALGAAPRSAAAAFSLSVRDSENEDLRGINVLKLARSADLKQVEKDLNATPGIEYAHIVPARWLAAPPKPVTSDKFLSDQWGLKAIGWTTMGMLPDAGLVKVGVLDTGVDLTHPDLKNIVSSYVHDGAGATDIVGHGSHVAGIIAAEINNKIGIAGICKCDLMVWKIFGDAPDPQDGQFYVDEVMYQRALNAARQAGVKVVNLSIGGTGRNQTEELLIKRLFDSGTLVVAAMGNEFQRGNPKEFPAGFPNVFAVGATTQNNQRASFSNTGSHIAIAAPGNKILSTLPMKPSIERSSDEVEYAKWSGTSMATPHVVAAAALVFAKTPNLTPKQVGDKLKAAAVKLPAMNGKKTTPEFGAGLLNLLAALS
ncbi:MAG: S8 family serine peptidase [Acidobacteriota bacterium]